MDDRAALDEATQRRIVCPSCGTEQEMPGGLCARCVICAKPLVPLEVSAAHEPRERAAPPTMALPASEPKATPLEDVTAVLASHKRVTSWLSLVPVWGPWKLSLSSDHAPHEKMRLYLASAALSGALVAGVWLALPGAHERAVEQRHRVEDEVRLLRGLVEEYRRQRGALPDANAWQQSAQSGDLRFYDPWGHLYRYESDGGGYSISTLGRDGREGGSGEDADVVRRFDAAPKAPQAEPPPPGA